MSDDGLDFETLAESDGEKGFGVPLNIFFTNARGQAARVLLETEGGTPQLFN